MEISDTGCKSSSTDNCAEANQQLEAEIRWMERFTHQSHLDFRNHTLFRSRTVMRLHVSESASNVYCQL